MKGVLVMAYGSPQTLADVEPYLADVRGGRPFTAGALAELRERYRRIGLPSPLRAITEEQAMGLEAALGDGYRVFVGMKHWRPRIVEAVRAIADAGIEHVIAIAMAPHHAGMSIGGYQQRIVAARDELGASFDLVMVPDWYRQPAFIDLVATNLTTAMSDWPSGRETRVFFTAHSLPTRIIAQGDPYRAQLMDSAALIAQAAHTHHWELAFQSASATGEPWLGPDVLDRIDAFADDGGTHAVVAPIGFVSDHLEILYDVDIECAERARSRNLHLARVPSPNASPRLITAITAAVLDAERHGPREPIHPSGMRA